jgi:hypothetical protein
VTDIATPRFDDWLKPATFCPNLPLRRSGAMGQKFDAGVPSWKFPLLSLGTAWIKECD